MSNLNAFDIYFSFLLFTLVATVVSITLAKFYKSMMLRIRSSYSIKFAFTYILLFLLISVFVPTLIRVNLNNIISIELYSYVFLVYMLLFLTYVLKASRNISNNILIIFLFLFTIVSSYFIYQIKLTEGLICGFFSAFIISIGRILSSQNVKNPVSIELNVYMPAVYRIYAKKYFLKDEDEYIYFDDNVEILNFNEIDIKYDTKDNYLHNDKGVLLRVPTGKFKRIDFYVDYILETAKGKKCYTTVFVIIKDDYGVYRIRLMNSYNNYLQTFFILIKKIFTDLFSKKVYFETINQYNSSIFKNNIYYPSLNFEDILNKIKKESNIEKSVAYIAGQFGSGKTTLAHTILGKSQNVVFNYQHDHSDYEDLLSDMANDLLGWRGFYGFLKIPAFLTIISIFTFFIAFNYKINTIMIAQSIFDYIYKTNIFGVSSFFGNYENNILIAINISIYFLIVIITVFTVNCFNVAIGLINFGSGIQTKKIIKEIANQTHKKNVSFIFDEIDRNVNFETTYKNLQTISYLKTKKDDGVIGIVNFDEKMLKREQCRYNQFNFIVKTKSLSVNRGEQSDTWCELADYACDHCQLLNECKLQQLLKKKYIKINIKLYLSFRKYVLSVLLYSRTVFKEATGILIAMEGDKLRKLVEILLMLEENQINFLMLPLKYKNYIGVSYSEAITTIRKIMNSIHDDIMAVKRENNSVSFISLRNGHTQNDFTEMENLTKKLGIHQREDIAQFIEDCGQIANKGIKYLENEQYNWLINLMDLNDNDSNECVDLLEFLSDGFKTVPNTKMQNACMLENFRDLKYALVEYYDNLDKIQE